MESNPELFKSSYDGTLLHVSLPTDELLANLFPEVDRPSIYREVDAWLWANPRRRPKSNIRRFLVNWMQKEKRRTPLYEEARKEINVGKGPHA
jgi:hypothetical protein